MFNISTFFQKLTKIHQTRDLEIGNVATVINKVTGLKIGPEVVKLDNGIIRLNLSPVLKNEVFMRRSQIIEALTSLGAKVRDIK